MYIMCDSIQKATSFIMYVYSCIVGIQTRVGGRAGANPNGPAVDQGRPQGKNQVKWRPRSETKVEEP